MKNFKLCKKIQPEAKIINIFTDDPFDISYFKDISNKNILYKLF